MSKFKNEQLFQTNHLSKYKILMYCNNWYYYGNSPAIKFDTCVTLLGFDIGLQSWSTNFILYHPAMPPSVIFFQINYNIKGCRILFLILSMLLFLCVLFCKWLRNFFYGSLSQSDILLLQIKIQKIGLKNYDDEVWWTVRNEILTCFFPFYLVHSHGWLMNPILLVGRQSTSTQKTSKNNNKRDTIKLGHMHMAC